MAATKIRKERSGITPATTIATSEIAQRLVRVSVHSQSVRASPSGARRRKAGLIDSAEYCATTRLRNEGHTSESGAMIANRAISASGASKAITTNSGTDQGFIS